MLAPIKTMLRERVQLRVQKRLKSVSNENKSGISMPATRHRATEGTATKMQTPPARSSHLCCRAGRWLTGAVGAGSDNLAKPPQFTGVAAAATHGPLPSR